MKEEIKTLENELNKMEMGNLSDAELKILVIRIHKELNEDFNSIKKMQSDMNDTLIKIKNNLEGNNSREDEAKDQINDLEQRKQKTTNQNKKKNESKKCGECKQSLEQLQEVQCSHCRCARRRRERARN